MIKVEWGFDYRDGSFDSSQVFDTWELANAKIKDLTESFSGEVFCVTIMD